MGRIEELAERFAQHIATPWQRTVAGAQRVIMVVMAVHVTSAREGLLMVSALLGVIGVALIVLAPPKP